MTFLAEPTQVPSHSKLIVASTENGFSLIELLIVFALIGIMTAFAIFALMPHRNLYRTDDQALRILDFMRDASQRALSQRQTMRLEIDQTNNVIRILDENQLGTADDRVVRQEPLENPINVRMYLSPAAAGPPTISGPPNIGGGAGTVVVVPPPAPSNFPAAAYAACLNPLAVSHSPGHNGWTARFLSSGSVINAGTDAAGTGAAVTSATLYLWPPQASDPNTSTAPGAVRAITIFGGTGVVRLWAYNGAAFVAR